MLISFMLSICPHRTICFEWGRTKRFMFGMLMKNRVSVMAGGCVVSEILHPGIILRLRGPSHRQRFEHGEGEEQSKGQQLAVFLQGEFSCDTFLGHKDLEEGSFEGFS